MINDVKPTPTNTVIKLLFASASKIWSVNSKAIHTQSFDTNGRNSINEKAQLIPSDFKKLFRLYV